MRVRVPVQCSSAGLDSVAWVCEMGSNTWEDLRREARKLEAQLDAKVASYAKLSSGSVSDVPLTSAIETRRLLNDSSSSSSSGSSLGTNTSSGAASKSSATKSYLDTVTAMSSEIEQLLGHLSNVNSAMENIVTSSGVADSSRTHTLARHGDILMDFSQEFRRLNAANIHLQNRNALLNDQQPSGKSKNPNNGSGSENDGNDHLALNIGGTSNYRWVQSRSSPFSS